MLKEEMMAQQRTKDSQLNRLVVFSHFDKDDRIAPYVCYYLKKLSESNCSVIFVSDSNLSRKETKKIKKYSIHSICGNHFEYDFGSYKRGYLYAKKSGVLDHIDELIFCNDSCFAPVYPFNEMFTAMNKQVCDFWGVTESEHGFKKQDNILVEEKNRHIQSYFIAFRKIVFLSSVFDTFIDTIKREKDKLDVILNYELKLTSILGGAGFSSTSYVPSTSFFSDTHSIFKCWNELLQQYHSPFLKYQAITLYHANFRILSKNYPIRFISENIIHRMGLMNYLRIVDSRFYTPIRFLYRIKKRVKLAISSILFWERK